MTTKLVYFRPDRRFVQDDLLEDRYTCSITDKFTTAQNTVIVPVYLTIFQHHSPKPQKKKQKQRNGHMDKLLPIAPSLEYLDKICFYLIGSKQSPPVHEYSEYVDRIEFHGHIGFEEPVFEILKQLRMVRKVAFFINLCKQRNFVPAFVKEITEEEGAGNNGYAKLKGEMTFMSNSITSLKIIMEQCDSNLCTDRDMDELPVKSVPDECSRCHVKLSFAKRENLKNMIIRLLGETVRKCPNIKRLKLDIPNWNGVVSAVDDALIKLQHLKSTKVLIASGRILVQKCTELTQKEHEGIRNIQQACDSENVKLTSLNSDQQQDDTDEDQENKEASSDLSDSSTVLELEQNTPMDPPEAASCLVDMSKLLGSMLGIPTSLKSSSQQSLPLVNLPLANCNTNTIINNSSNSNNNPPLPALQAPENSSPLNNTNTSNCKSTTSAAPNLQDQQCTQTTLASSTEIISYAAAAASGVAANNNDQVRSINVSSNVGSAGNGSRSHYHLRRHLHHHHHHIHHGSSSIISNEGSRKTFLWNDEGSVDDEESGSHPPRKKPSYHSARC